MSPLARRLTYLVLAYTCIEGLVVNLTFPSKIGYVAKDLILIAAIAMLFLDNRGRSFGATRFVMPGLAVFAFVQLAYAMMPGDLPLLARLTGLKMRLLYIPAMFLAYRLIVDEAELNRFARFLLICAIPVSIFGIYLFFAGPGALQQMGASYAAVITSTTGTYRVPGTFNSPGQYGLYLTFNSIVAVWMLMVPNQTKRQRILVITSLGIMLLAAIASGSRTPLVLTVACGTVVLLSQRRLGKLVTGSVAIYCLFAIAFSTLGEGATERMGSIASMEHVERFNRTYFGQMFIPRMMEAPMGLGLGIATIGARHFTEFNEIILVESYFGIIALETGIVGFITFFWASLMILNFILKTRGVMKGSPYSAAFHALGSFIALIALLSPVSTPLDASPGNVYFWFGLGVVARLYDLERARRGELTQEAPVYTWTPDPMHQQPMPYHPQR